MTGQGFRREQHWLGASAPASQSGRAPCPSSATIESRCSADRIIGRFGSPEDNPNLWRMMSARTYFSRSTEAILMIHGTRDESCPIRWARDTERALKQAGKDVTLVEYEGAGHDMYGPWYDSTRRVEQFLARTLRG